ncbi:MAG: hypothetical protein ACLST7_04055 [Oscillospiraceae bacterium]
MSKKDNIYLIGAASYEDTVEQRLTLYSYIRQLAFLAKHMKTAEDYIHLKRAAAAYGDKAEELFASWDIPGRYLVYGDPGDLDALREKELLDYGEDDGDDLTEDDLTEDDFPDDNGEDFEGEDFEGEAFLDLLADMAGKARFVSEVLDTLLEISGGQPDSAASEHE